MTEAGSQPEPSRLRLYGLIALMTLFWSINYIIAKMALREFPALLATGLRTGLAGLLILVFYVFRRRHDWTRRDVPILLYLGVCGVVLNQLFFIMGIGRTSVGHAAIVIALTPVLVLFIAWAAGQEHLRAAKLGGMAIALTGVALLQLTHANGSTATFLGDLFIFGASLTFAISL